MLKISQNAPKPVTDKEFAEDVKIFNTRLDYYVDLIKNTFNQFPQFYQSHFGKMKNKMNFIEIPPKEKTIDFEKWENVKKFYLQKSKKLEEINQLTNQEEKLNQLNEICKDFSEEHNSLHIKVNPEVEKLFLEISAKLNYQHEKLEIRNKILEKNEKAIKQTLRQLIFRLKKELPETAILKELKKSLNIDEKKTEKFNNLRQDWFNFIIFYRTLECQMKNARMAEATIPKLKEYNEKLREYKDSLPKPKIKNIMVSDLYLELEKEENYYVKLHNQLKTFENSYIQLHETIKKIKELQVSYSSNLNPYIQSILTEKGKEDYVSANRKTDYSFLENNMNEKLKTQNINLTSLYRNTEEAIKQEQLAFDEKLKEINENLSEYGHPFISIYTTFG